MMMNGCGFDASWRRSFDECVFSRNNIITFCRDNMLINDRTAITYQIQMGISVSVFDNKPPHGEI